VSDFGRDCELELERDMKRFAAPERFADGVMARISASRRPPVQVERRRFQWGWPVFAMAMILLAVAVTTVVDHQRERRRAEAAEARFEAAMQITSRTLARVDYKVSRVGIKPSNN